MGGIGSGGARHGSGRKRKPKPAHVALVHGAATAQARAQVAAAKRLAAMKPSSPPAVETFDAPDSLTPAEREVWLKQAPNAFAARTLTPATALAFERYCRIVVLEAGEAMGSGVSGANHRGLLKMITDLESRFCLAPTGSPLVEDTPDASDEDDEIDRMFFGGGRSPLPFPGTASPATPKPGESE